MKESQGKFIIFNLPEFGSWLNSVSVNRAIRLIQNHHTYEPSYADFNSNHFALLKGMEDYHVKKRGFSEIAQNLTTFPDGTIAVCRSLNKAPAGTKGANTGGICIENLGNFDSGQDQMTPAHRATIIKLNALLCNRFGLQPDSRTIIYHHWYDLNTGKRTNGTGTTKSCPGTGFFGGNKVDKAEANFIPLIAQELQVPDRVAPAPPGVVILTGRVKSDTLNVRTYASASAKKITRLNKGAVINAYEVNNNWWRIHPQESQWVSGRFVDRITD
jgi:hypothetical protein